jgi:hypothetical protein
MRPLLAYLDGSPRREGPTDSMRSPGEAHALDDIGGMKPIKEGPITNLTPRGVEGEYPHDGESDPRAESTRSRLDHRRTSGR